MNRTTDKAGYGVIVEPGKTQEFDTLTCCHCNRVGVVKSTEKDARLMTVKRCTFCMDFICDFCDGKPCMNFEKRLDLYERDQALFERLGLSLT